MPATFTEKFIRWLWKNRHADSTHPFLHALINFLKIIFIVSSEFRRNLLPLRTNSLTFTVTLSLVPVLAMGTAILKGMGAGGELRKTAYRFVDQVTALPDTDMRYGILSETDTKLQGEAGTEDYSASGHLRKAIDKIFDYVDNTNFATIGIMGIIGVLITVISLLSYIEEAMNTIWNTSGSRSIGRKIIDYLAIVIMLPLAINIGFWAMAALQTQAYITIPQRLKELVPIITMLLKLLPAMFIIAIFAMLYRFLPNTRVKTLPAVAGAVIGGISWLLLQALYIKLQIGVARYNAIYGSFASMPLFLLWVYSGWLVFLTGAEISYAIQMYRYYRPPLPDETPYSDTSAAFDMMLSLCAAFRQGGTLSLSELAGHTGTGIERTWGIAEKLERHGIIRETSGKENHGRHYIPAKPCDEITRQEVFEAIYGRARCVEQCSAGERLAASAAVAAGKALEGSLAKEMAHGSIIEKT